MYYPKEVSDFSEEIISILKTDEKTLNELKEEGFNLRIFEGKLKDYALKKFLDGNEIILDKDTFDLFLNESIVEGVLENIIDKKLIDFIDNGKGETIYFATRELKTILGKRNC